MHFLNLILYHKVADECTTVQYWRCLNRNNLTCFSSLPVSVVASQTEMKLTSLSSRTMAHTPTRLMAGKCYEGYTLQGCSS